jgi:ribosomal protein L24
MGNSFSPRKGEDVDVSQGPPKTRKGDVMQIHGAINTRLVQGESAPSSSRQDTHVVRPLDFMIELVLHNSFSWVF